MQKSSVSFQRNISSLAGESNCCVAFAHGAAGGQASTEEQLNHSLPSCSNIPPHCLLQLSSSDSHYKGWNSVKMNKSKGACSVLGGSTQAVFNKMNLQRPVLHINTIKSFISSCSASASWSSEAAGESYCSIQYIMIPSLGLEKLNCFLLLTHISCFSLVCAAKGCSGCIQGW